MTVDALPRDANAAKAFFPAAPAASGKSYFFASRRACAGSGVFSAQDCAAAFDRVGALIRERAPIFAEKIDCVVQFKLCEGEAAGYLPTILGVEIVRSPKGFVALPMLAVDTPRDMLREPAPPPASATPSDAPRRAGGGSVAPSPFGALALETRSLTPVGPPSLKSYHGLIEEVLLRLAAFQQGAKPRPMWRAER